MKPRLAIIVPCLNEEDSIKTTVEKLFDVINSLITQEKISSESFLYIIDDGSKDKTWEIIQSLHETNPLVKGMKFIRNFGNQKAIIAGLEGAYNLGCDCVVSIDGIGKNDRKPFTIHEYQIRRRT